jgi:diguanylate cyclase (GGDEF)-like protein
MSASVPSDLESRAPIRAAEGRWNLAPFALRLGIGLDRRVWPVDRATAEFRWAALTASVMLALVLPAYVLTGSGDYGNAALVSTIAFVTFGTLAWSPFAPSIAQRAVVRRAIGPLLVLIALAAVGPYDQSTLAAPAARPLVILALTFAALTPGFSIAVLIVAVASIGLVVEHASLPGHQPVDVHTVDFLLRVSVTFLAAGAVHYVDRGLRRERRRAEGLAARKVKQVDQLEGLQRIVRRFDGSRPVAAVMQDVVDDVATTFDIPLVSAYLPDESGRLSMVGVAGYDSPFHVIQTGVGIIGRAAASHQTIFVPDVLTDPDYRAARSDVRSEVAVPVLHGDELVGIVNFEGTADKPIGPAHIAIAEMLARSIAAGLRSARLDEERQQRLHAIERVLEVSRGLAADLDRPRVVASVADAARDLLEAQAVEFASRGADGRFRVEQVAGDGFERIGSVVVPGEGLGGQVLASAERVVWGGDAGDAGRGVGLGLPIRLQGEVSAVLTASRGSSELMFSELDLRIADLLVTQIEVALQNAELHARVSEAAVRDQLTGLLNRRYFDEAVETAFANVARSGAPLSLVVLDLDRFSEVNNVHGHAVGDTVLRRVARAMAGAVRNGDIVARYGGEEFVVIAPDSGTEGAMALAERIRMAVAAESKRPFDGLSIPLTISAGVASRLGDELDGRALFRAADSALRAAKRAGLDRVVSL